MTPYGEETMTDDDVARVARAIEEMAEALDQGIDWEDLARAAIAAMPSPWRSMASAPKDGRPVLILRYLKGSRVNRQITGAEYWKGDWKVIGGGVIGLPPVAWMPLPSPPAPGDQGETPCP